MFLEFYFRLFVLEERLFNVIYYTGSYHAFLALNEFKKADIISFILHYLLYDGNYFSFLLN